MTKISAFQVAQYFIAKSHEENRGISNKKLQKLIYYAQAWHLALYDSKFFDDEIQAWIHGPAIPHIYGKYKSYGYNDINDDEKLAEAVKPFNKRQLYLLQSIWEAYGKYDAEYLELLSHSEEPWQRARGESLPFESSTAIIDTEDMRRFYSSLYGKTQQE